MKELVMYMKQVDVLIEDTNEDKKLKFFLEKIKLQIKKLQSEKHTSCCQNRCGKVGRNIQIASSWSLYD